MTDTITIQPTPVDAAGRPTIELLGEVSADGGSCCGGGSCGCS